MNGNRIRYSVLADGSLKSKNLYPHPSNGSRYRVKINLNDLQWFIYDESSDGLVGEGYGATAHDLKKRAKKELESLGIEFDNDEKRVHKSTEPTT